MIILSSFRRTVCRITMGLTGSFTNVGRRAAVNKSGMERRWQSDS